MNTQLLNPTTLSATAITLATPALAANEDQSLNELLEQIKGKDDKQRSEAWQKAANLGAPAIKDLAALLEDKDVEVARAGKRAMWQIVRHAGRPGATEECKTVVAQLLPLVKKEAVPVQREVIWMLSEVAGNEAVGPVAALLSNTELREDARMVLERIPGPRSLTALMRGLISVPEDFKPNMAHSLRVRGEKVEGWPDQKLKPVKQTSVQPKQT